jgi:glycosyltransferase involved in cell wall biosynthesis
LKILFLLNSFYPSIGGVEKTIEDYCKELINLGNSISILTLKRGQISQINLSKLPNFEVYDGITIYRTKAGFLGFKLLYKLFALCINHKFDVVHSTDFWGFYSILLKYIFKYKLIHQLHGYQEICPTGLLLFGKKCLTKTARICYSNCMIKPHRYLIDKIMYKAIWLSSDLIITVSKAVKDKYLEINRNNIFSNKMLVLHNGVDVNNFMNLEKDKRKFLVKTPLNQEDKILLFVGRLISERRIDKIIENFSMLTRKIPNVKFLIVGGGPELSNLKNKVKKLKLEEFVQFLGILTGQDLKFIYSISDLFIIPIIFPEPFSTVVLESMSRGCPVITFNLGGMDEIISDKQDGVLIEPFNWDAFYKEMILLLSDQKRLDRLGKNANNKIKSHFNIKNQGLKLNYIYEKLISKDKK